MTVRRPPLFLARRSYRRRRMADAARLLPLLGIFLIFLPILWQPAQSPEPDTARGGIYLFAVWAVLVSGAFVLSRPLGATVEGDAGDGEAVSGTTGQKRSGEERSSEEPSGGALSGGALSGGALSGGAAAAEHGIADGGNAAPSGAAGQPGRDRRGEAR